jgi:GntR family transcriptional regulator, transcriptional repressor for pyruvate dehydrogenase complex
MENEFNGNNIPKLQKVTSQRIFEKAVEQIRELIQSGNLSPGQKLPTEQELGKQLNVSRSSVREALRVLESEGMVDVRRGLGTYIAEQPVKKQPADDAARWLEQREEALEQVLDVRERIESLAAYLAATRASDIEISDMRAIVETQIRLIEVMQSTGEFDYDILSKLDAAFHLAISTASDHDLAIEIIARLIPAFNESNKAVLYVSKRMKAMEKEHVAILNALEQRDPHAASKAIRDHIASVRDVIILCKKIKEKNQ